MSWWSEQSGHITLGAVAAAVGGAATWLGNQWRDRRAAAAENIRATADGKRSLSQSEAEFREDILGRLENTEKQLEECRQAHQDCRQNSLALTAEVSQLTDRVAELEERDAQRSLPLVHT